MCCSEEWAIIGLPTIRCISEQSWDITCNKQCCEVFYQNWVSHCYELVYSLRPYILPCSFGGTLVFWNPVSGGHMIACRACAQIPDVNPMFCHSAQVSSAKLWFVELAYHACVPDAGNPDVISSVVIQRHYRTFHVAKSIAIECACTAEWEWMLPLRTQIGWWSRV